PSEQAVCGAPQSLAALGPHGLTDLPGLTSYGPAILPGVGLILQPQHSIGSDINHTHKALQTAVSCARFHHGVIASIPQVVSPSKYFSEPGSLRTGLKLWKHQKRLFPLTPTPFLLSLQLNSNDHSKS
uniref:Uncharacterized protein n=1 Tax=Meleagris gallopavo TaxID=9103 RepID=A0A803XP41_MELGA